MYLLTVSVNGEITRESVFASIVDATDDYVSANATNPLGSIDADDVVGYLLSDDVHTVSATWDVPNPAGDEGATDTLRVAVTSGVSGEDIDPATFIASRAVVLSSEGEDGTIVYSDGDANATEIMAGIMAEVAAEMVNA